MARLVTFPAGQRVAGSARTQALLAGIPDQIVTNLKAAEDRAADQLVGQMKAIAPVGDSLEEHPGALRDSIHKEPGSTDISVKVVVDAKGADGAYIAKHVEHGHRFSQGGHAEPKPFFYPVLRLAKKGIRAALAKAVRDGLKQAAAGAGGD